MSSIRSTNAPSIDCANAQLYSAVRAPPTWKKPVGDGAKRNLIGRSVIAGRGYPGASSSGRGGQAVGGGQALSGAAIITVAICAG